MIELRADIFIDEGIAPLIQALWDQGYDTTFSCQGGNVDEGTRWRHNAYISFRTFDDGVRFMRHMQRAMFDTSMAREGTRGFYVHSGLYRLEIGDGYNPVTDNPDPLLPATGCVRFPTESGEYDMMAITTEIFTKEKASSKA